MRAISARLLFARFLLRSLLHFFYILCLILCSLPITMLRARHPQNVCIIDILSLFHQSTDTLYRHIIGAKNEPSLGIEFA